MKIISNSPFEQVINYPAETQSMHFGASGITVGAGIAVMSYGGELQLKPVSRRGRITGSARISVPYDQIDDLIAALIAVRDGKPQ